MQKPSEGYRSDKCTVFINSTNTEGGVIVKAIYNYYDEGTCCGLWRDRFQRQ